MKIILTNCDNLQNCLPSSSFSLFHDLKSKCADTDEQSTSASNEGEGDQEDTPCTDNYDIATSHFKNIVDGHVETDNQGHPTTKSSQIRHKFLKWISVCIRSLFG